MTLQKHFKAHPLVVLVLLLFIAYLISADWLVVAYTARKGDSVVAATSVASSLPPVTQYSVDSVHTTPGTLLERVEVSGWALPPEHVITGGSTNYAVQLVLAARGRLYRVPTVASKRRDVLDHLSLSDQSLRLGFSTSFTPVRMKGGVYRLGVMIRMNDRDAALSWSHFQFVQDRRGFRDYHFKPKVSAASAPEPFGHIEAHTFDIFTTDEAATTLVGWAWAGTGNVALDQEVVLVFKSDAATFELTSEKSFRPDLRAGFGDKMNVIGEAAGFRTSLPWSDLPAGRYKLGVLIREHSKPVAFRWMGQQYEHTSHGLARAGNTNP